MALLGGITLNGSDFQQSATKYRRELLCMPVVAALATLQHMTGRPGLAGKDTLGQLSGSIEIGPYDPERVDKTNVAVTPRTLETFLGSVVKNFDPNDVAKTILGEITAQGESLKKADIVRQVLNFLAAKLGQSLNMAIWNAKRDASGTKTKDLFDGFDTITAAEITAGNIAAAAGNYMKLTEAITDNNAYDVLTGIYRGADDMLKAVPTKLYVPMAVKEAYEADYMKTVGAIPYNTEYKKTFVQGSNNLCEIVPLASKKDSKFIHLSTKSNMLYGYGAGLADENLEVEKYAPFILSFVATMYFGTQFETISPERLMVAELADAAAQTQGSGTSGSGTQSENQGQGEGTENGGSTVVVEEPTAPEAPTISGTTPFDDSTEVTISAAEGATIHYTTDGSTPTAESTEYTEALTLSATTTVKAVAVKDDLTSEVASETFTKN